MNTARFVGLIVLIGTVLALTANARTREAGRAAEGSSHRSQAVDAMGGTMGMGATMGMMAATTTQRGAQSDAHRTMPWPEIKQKLQEQDTQLQELVARMNNATGDAQIEAMAKVVTELANRQSAMRMGMMDVQPQMADHMLEHMNDGMMSGMGSMMNGGTNGHMKQQAGSSR